MHTLDIASRYQECVIELESRGIMPDRPPSLLNTKLGLNKIGFENYNFYKTLLNNPYKVIVIAGTNGKGSVAATLEALLMSKGFRVGLYCSPHLVETTERIRINQTDISTSDFIKAYNFVCNATNDLKLTHFEMLTLMAIYYFCSGNLTDEVDYLILEVGLGGIWDATNAIPHGTCVITSLGMDHEKLLGPTIKDIAKNKFGIIPSRSSFLYDGAKVFHHPLPNEVLDLAKSVEQKTKSTWTETISFELEITEPKNFPNDEPKFTLYTPLGKTRLLLPGLRGAQNTALALTAFNGLGFDVCADVLGSPLQVKWPGRMEKVRITKNGAAVYLSGDHNPHGILSLCELLKHYPYNTAHLIIGIGAEKDVHGIFSTLTKIPRSRWYLTVTPFRGLKITDYDVHGFEEFIDERESDFFKLFNNVESRYAKHGDLILITGSLYLVGLAKKNKLLNQPYPKS